MVKTKTSNYEITLAWLTEKSIDASLSATLLEPGVDLVQISMTAPIPTMPPPCTLSWIHPLVNFHALWRTSENQRKSLLPDGRKLTTKTMFQAPVCCFHSFGGQNRLTFAFSDALHTLQMSAGVHEESATLHCSLDLFGEPSSPLTKYEATLRIDTRIIPYYKSLEDVQQWWASQPGYQPALVPQTARLPMYSTWYSFHQQLVAAQVEEQCRLAKAFGCEAVIVDDGWQTSGVARDYAYTGDWEVAAEKIPDMKTHVAHVHELGMKYLLWYAVPFVGIHSKAYDRFADKLLETIDTFDAGVLDPRFPDVREYIVSTYEQAMRAWDLDGFKLDFIDSFAVPNPEEQKLAAGQDYLSVPEAVDRLLSDLLARLKAIKPHVMLEFRQPYIGPRMRKYANMFRAADCPYDALTNRIRTLDLRLLCGESAVHADMLMWHQDEPVESAALQIVNILFAVPQISVRLDTLPPQHLAMIRHWLAFWRQHRDVLLDGELLALHPEANYPLVMATTPEKRIVAMYQDTVVNPDLHLPRSLIVVNGTLERRMVLEFAEDAGTRQLTISDCQGQVSRQERVHISKGLLRIEVPAAGVVTLVANEPARDAAIHAGFRLRIGTT
jgi:alpha-galactosidase